jgi:prepilin peptidase dependent protein B
MHLNHNSCHRAERGMSLVELLVGMVVGLFIVAGATYFVVNFNADNRRMLLEARLNQDMRAAMDVITRDVRRAGYWQNAYKGASYYGQVGTPLPYDATGYPTMTPAPGTTANAITYAYSKPADPDEVADATEQYGFALANGVLTTTIGTSGAQPLTDSGTTVVDTFTATMNAVGIDMVCPGECPVAGCPQSIVREVAIVLTAHALTDATVVRTLRNNVRIRNDRQTGTC